jgi:hypothetical protein
MRTSYLLSATAMAMLVGATAASAGTLTIKNVEVDPGPVYGEGYNYVNITGNVSPIGVFTKDSQISGLILLTTSTGQTLPVFCVDLFHDVAIGGPQSLMYQTAQVTTDSTGTDSGTGNLLSTSPPVAKEIQTLVNIGYSGYVHGNLDGDHLTALQDAIWDIEYSDTGTINGFAGLGFAGFRRARAKPAFA